MNKLRNAFRRLVICMTIIVMVLVLPITAIGMEGPRSINVSSDIRSSSIQPPTAKYTGIHKGDDGQYYLFINGVWQKDATYIYKKTQYIKNGIWQKDFTGFYKSARDGKSYLIVNGIFQKGATYIYKKTYYVKDGVWRNKFSGFYTSERDGKSYLIINGIFQNDATYLYPKDGKCYYVKNGTWRNKFNGFYVSAYDGNSYLVIDGILQSGVTYLYPHQDKIYYVKDGMWQKDYNGFYQSVYDGNSYLVLNGLLRTDATYLYKEKEQYRYLKNGMWQKTFEGIYTSIYDGQNYYIKDGIWDSKKCLNIEYEGFDWVVRKGMASKVSNESDRTLWRAMNVLMEITTEDMTDEEKLRASFDYVRSHYPESRPRMPHYTGMDWPVIYANDMFVRGTGNCCSYGAAFAYIAKAIGYEEVYACNSGGHGWAEIDGRIYDPEWSKHGPVLHPQYTPYDYYGTTYTPQMTDMNYRGGIGPGAAYMHIKI